MLLGFLGWPYVQSLVLALDLTSLLFFCSGAVPSTRLPNSQLSDTTNLSPLKIPWPEPNRCPRSGLQPDWINVSFTQCTCSGFVLIWWNRTWTLPLSDLVLELSLGAGSQNSVIAAFSPLHGDLVDDYRPLRGLAARLMLVQLLKQ